MNTPLSGRPDRRRMEPLWDRVDRNRWLIVVYLSLFAVLGGVWYGLIYAGIALGISAGFSSLDLLRLLLGTTPASWVLHALAFGVLITALYEWRALSISERGILHKLEAQLVPTGQSLPSKLAVKDMAIAAGLPVAPAFYVLPTDNVNALVLHPLGRRPSIGVSQGMLDKLSVAEQRAVYANLVARIANGDARLATAISAIVAPLQAWRAQRERQQNEAIDRELIGGPAKPQEESLGLLILFGPVMALVVEIIVATHRRSQLKAAEKADADGMLLLKDPGDMLSALERCVWLDNVVPQVGETFGQLFYCWSGDSTNDENDPEWRRVARLREVLGVEGAADI